QIHASRPVMTNSHEIAALPINTNTTSLTTEYLTRLEAAKLREGFDHRLHQCNSCGMHHCHMQVIRSGDHKGTITDEPEYEGWSGAGWTIGLTDPQSVSWLNTELDRACLDVNALRWRCGWGVGAGET